MVELYELIVSYLEANPMYMILADMVVIASILALFYSVVRRNSKAKRKFMLILLFGLVYLIIKISSLPIANIIFDGIIRYWVLLIIVIFLNEFRILFENFELRFSKGRSEATEGQFMRTIMASVESLSKARTGALISIEREQSLNDYIEKAIILNADISEELIESIFNTQAPTHDGAVIIQDGKIACCGAYFPSTSSDKIAKTIGSRHRAALGISEIFDCLTIVVSEETGRISVTIDGFIERNLTKEGLQSFLMKYLD